MLRVGIDISEQELPHIVRERLIKGVPYLHVSGIDLEPLNSDERAERIHEICRSIGNLTLSNNEPASDIWSLDSRTSPSAQLVDAHTDNPFKGKPEDIVAFWNIRSSTVGGENVITPLERVIELGERSKQLDEILQKAQLPLFTFSHNGESWTGPVINSNEKTVRYDAKYLGSPSTELKYLFEEAVKAGDAIKLAPGDVLFLSNTTTVHARLPYSELNRLSIRTRINL